MLLATTILLTAPTFAWWPFGLAQSSLLSYGATDLFVLARLLSPAASFSNQAPPSVVWNACRRRRSASPH